MKMFLAFHLSCFSSFSFPMVTLYPHGHGGWQPGLRSCLCAVPCSQTHSSTSRTGLACSICHCHLRCLAHWCSHRYTAIDASRHLPSVSRPNGLSSVWQLPFWDFCCWGFSCRDFWAYSYLCRTWACSPL